MLFSSITFLFCFLPIVLLIYYYCPVVKARNCFLLFASLIFYAWGEPKYVLVMLVSIAVNYRTGLLLGEAGYSTSARRCILAAGILINVSLLFYFKYFVFSELIINKILQIIHYPQFQLPVLHIVLPLGISFYTFQSISYLVDGYKKPALIQKNLLDLGLYIAFFPALIAGPIVRYHDIQEQIKNRSPSLPLFTAGIERFIIGLSKKLLIANSVGMAADRIMDLPPNSVPWYFLVLGILCYTLQIYYDFSGYSDMAIGLGKMFGFNLLENFNYPYMAKTITEFWRRWHISLSSWFKDYLYIPLGGNRKGQIRRNLNLFIVFFTTGLWHGAAINFIVWGLGHGGLLFLEKTFGKRVALLIKHEQVKKIAGHLYTLAAVILLWVFFRLGTKQSLKFLRNIFLLNPGQEGAALFIKTMINPQFIFCFIAGVLFAFPWWRNMSRVNVAPLRYCALLVLLILSICSLASNAYNPFIYFRF